ncbi:MAG: hypothetical protein LBT91_00635 [Bifidobacteriaceae bacterium]|jgi:hypothetical protein|nr:hypothetical protein [Bifidobacteriaceae bacterium]
MTTVRQYKKNPLPKPTELSRIKPLDYYLDIAKKVNPKLNIEKGFDCYSPFVVNCQRCVVTYEMRRRGLKVKAKPVYYWQEKKDIISNGTNRAWVDPDTGFIPDFKNIPPIKDKTQAINEIRDFISEKYPVGKKRVFTLQWGRTNTDMGEPRAGHVVIVQEINGQLYFIDPQTGESAEKRLANEFETNMVKIDSLKFLRIDNKKINKAYNAKIYQNENKKYNMFLTKISSILKKQNRPIPNRTDMILD